MGQQTRQPGRVGWTAAAAALVVLVASWPVSEASARDSDGSRLGARVFELGSTAEGELAPPEDASDWRYFENKTSRTFKVRLSHEPVDAEVTFKMTRATGDTVEKATTTDGEAELEVTLESGLHYVEVSSEAEIDYELSIESDD